MTPKVYSIQFYAMLYYNFQKLYFRDGLKKPSMVYGIFHPARQESASTDTNTISYCRSTPQPLTQLPSTTRKPTHTHTPCNASLRDISSWLIDLWPTKRMTGGIRGEQRNTWMDQVTGTTPLILEKVIPQPHELGWTCISRAASV